MIRSLHLEGFKNFRDATLSIGPLTVIVGTNASGKSNLRDAFRFLHGMSRNYSLADIVGEKFVEGVLQWRGIRGGAREIASFGQSSFTLTTSLVLETDPPTTPVNYRHLIAVEAGNGTRPLRLLREMLYADDRVVYESCAQDGPIVGNAAEQIRVLLHETVGVVPAVYLSSRPLLSQLAAHFEARWGILPPPSHVVSQFGSMRFLDLSPEAMRNPSMPGQPLGDRGENLSSALQAICEDLYRKQAITEWIQQLTPLDVVDFEFVPDQTGKILLSLVESNGQKTSAYSASDGTLRFLAMIAAFMGPDAAQFYFLEEIDNGIHPTRLNLLLQLIEQQAKSKKLQVVTTTHSPQLLAMLSPKARENAYLAYRLENETEAHLQRILDIPTARDVLGRQNLARLHESGWLENMVAFARPEESDT